MPKTAADSELRRALGDEEKDSELRRRSKWAQDWQVHLN